MAGAKVLDFKVRITWYLYLGHCFGADREQWDHTFDAWKIIVLLLLSSSTAYNAGYPNLCALILYSAH